MYTPAGVYSELSVRTFYNNYSQLWNCVLWYVLGRMINIVSVKKTEISIRVFLGSTMAAEGQLVSHFSLSHSIKHLEKGKKNV